MLFVLCFSSSVYANEKESTKAKNHKGVKSTSLKISVLSDIHYYDSSLGVEGKAFEDYLEGDRKLLAESSAILNSAVEDIKNSDAEVVLISGDLTKDGEQVNHLAVAEILKELEAKGKKVYITHGNHDILNPNAVRFDGNTTTPVDYVTPKEFKKIYADFGYKEAIAKDPKSLSYVVEPTDDTRIIVMDSVLYDTNIEDDYPKTGGALSSNRLEWILKQIEDAKKKNKRIIGMTHHGVVQHFGVQEQFFKDYLVNDWEDVSTILADAGLNVVFTGHFHAQDAVSKTTAVGNTIYDIETGSLVTYPAPYREVEIIDNKMKINTVTVDEIDFDTGNQTFPVYAKGFLKEGMKKLVPNMLAQIYIKQGMPPAQALLVAQTITQMEVAPSITVGSLISNAMVQHYTGDEKIDPTTNVILQGMMSSSDPNVKMLGGAVYSILSDEIPDNNLEIDLPVLEDEKGKGKEK